ncbi:hypothetical protein M422DRAFT_73449 [Sphaerobolus stellatus SS14]|nr:hypothetical protein M422DRAFT_73449 [Sphaerobolus stellatus SS14]
MKGLQIVEYKQPYKLSTTISIPQIKRHNEVLIKVAVAGYCHGDLMIQHSNIQDIGIVGQGLPLIPSHEGAGIVVAIGSGVKHLKIGDRVGALAYKNPCGTCQDCTNGLETSCNYLELCGVTVDGAAAEYLVADGNATVKIPESIPFEVGAPLMCAGATIYAGIKKVDLKQGDWLAIVGVGALGHIGVQLAKCLGFRVVAVDNRQTPLDLAMSLKYAPDFAINSSTTSVESALKMIGEGVHGAVIAADTNSAYDFGLKLTRKHGTLVAIGLPPEAIMVHYTDLIFRNLTLKSAQLGSPELTREMVDIVAKHGIEAKTYAYPLEDVDTLIHDYHKPDRAGKSVMIVSEELLHQ